MENRLLYRYTICLTGQYAGLRVAESCFRAHNMSNAMRRSLAKFGCGGIYRLFNSPMVTFTVGTYRKRGGPFWSLSFIGLAFLDLSTLRLVVGLHCLTCIFRLLGVCGMCWMVLAWLFVAPFARSCFPAICWFGILYLSSFFLLLSV